MNKILLELKDLMMTINLKSLEEATHCYNIWVKMRTNYDVFSYDEVKLANKWIDKKMRELFKIKKQLEKFE